MGEERLVRYANTGMRPGSGSDCLRGDPHLAFYEQGGGPNDLIEVCSARCKLIEVCNHLHELACFVVGGGELFEQSIHVVHQVRMAPHVKDIARFCDEQVVSREKCPGYMFRSFALANTGMDPVALILAI